MTEWWYNLRPRNNIMCMWINVNTEYYNVHEILWIEFIGAVATVWFVSKLIDFLSVFWFRFIQYHALSCCVTEYKMKEKKHYPEYHFSKFKYHFSKHIDILNQRTTPPPIRCTRNEISSKGQTNLCFFHGANEKSTENKALI